MKGRLIEPGTHFITGNVAIAEAALLAGCRFYAGYPITPSSDLMHHIAARMVEVGGVFIQAEDEIAAINMVLGASAAGLKAMTATSGPGLSLMEEGLDLGFMLELPAVIVDVQRVGPSTGIPTLGSQGDVMQVIWGSHGDRTTVAYAPSSPQECFDFTIKAFNAAEMLRMPVFVLSDEFVAHSYGKVVVPDHEEIRIIERKKLDGEKPEKLVPYPWNYTVPPFAEPGRGFRFHYTGLVHDDRGYPVIDKEVTKRLLQRLMGKVEEYRNEIVEVSLDDEDFKGSSMVVAYGSVYRIIKTAYRRDRGFRQSVCIFRPKTLWPPPDVELRDVIKKKGIDRVVVVEMNMGQYVHVVKDVLQGLGVSIALVKLVPGFYPSPKEVKEMITEVIERG